jgi:hypothetical protein
MAIIDKHSKRGSTGSSDIQRQRTELRSLLLTLSMIVTLTRTSGYISDEDTSIYNPGLTLLTESEEI